MTPTLSEADAVTFIVPETAALFAGEVMEVVGGVVSGLLDIASINVEVPVPPLFVAPMVTFVVPAVVGVPEMRPDEVFTESPEGRPVALYDVGVFDPVI